MSLFFIAHQKEDRSFVLSRWLFSLCLLQRLEHSRYLGNVSWSSVKIKYVSLCVMFSTGRFTMLKVLALILTSQLPQTLWAHKGVWLGNVGNMVDSAGHISSIFLHSLPHRLGESLIGPRWLFLFARDKFRNWPKPPTPWSQSSFQKGV